VGRKSEQQKRARTSLPRREGEILTQYFSFFQFLSTFALIRWIITILCGENPKTPVRPRPGGQNPSSKEAPMIKIEKIPSYLVYVFGF
jgi:hypothetical protein